MIAGQDINSYMAKWKQGKRRKRRTNIGRSEYVHATEVPSTVASQIVEMRHNGKTWSQIAHQFNFTEYLTRNIYQLNKR